jgi:hypothetical protein
VNSRHLNEAGYQDIKNSCYYAPSSKNRFSLSVKRGRNDRFFGLLIVPLIVISEYAAALAPALLCSKAFLNLLEIASGSYPP